MINLKKIPFKSCNNMLKVLGFSSLNKNAVKFISTYNHNPLYIQTKFHFNNNKSPSPQKINIDTQKQKQMKPQQPKSKFNPEQQITPQQQALINSHKPDQVFNLLLNLQEKHNFQKDLVVARKIYQRSTKQLRANILFEDLLKSEIQITVYDTKGKPYFHMWMKNLFNIAFFALTVWFVHAVSGLSDKNKVILQRTTSGRYLVNLMYFFAGWFLVAGFWKYFKFQRRFIQKVVYDTKTQNFFMTKRSFFGGRKVLQVSRYKVVYTQNQFLNKKGINYFNLDTKDQYSIPYKQAWVKQDLFSHLIAQRIKI